MRYIVITKEIKIVVSQEQRDKLLLNINTSKSPILPLNGQHLNRFDIRIFELEFFIKQESDTLRLKGLRRCKHCSEIANRQDKCACFDKPELRENNIFKLQEKQPILLTQQSHERKDFKKVSVRKV